MTFERQLGAGCLVPVRGADVILGVIFKILFVLGGGSFSDIKGALLGGSFNC